MHPSVRSKVATFLTPFPLALTVAQKIYNAPNAALIPFRKTESDFLHDVAARKAEVFFLQIGAGDGKTDDPLYPFVRNSGWKGILVEPNRYQFDQLVANYRGTDGLIFENKAVAEEEGIRTFYRVRQDAPLSNWAHLLGSFRRDVVLSAKHHFADFEDYVIAEPVECITFDSLMVRHAVTCLDVVVIDTEGYDLQLLQQIDLARFRPDLVIYEQKHLSRHEKKQAIDLLDAHGYAVQRVGNGWNNVAVRRDNAPQASR